MSDIALFFGTIIGAFFIGLALYMFEKYRGCWHKWGAWEADSTEDAYIQIRQCEACGYTEIEQFRKLKAPK